MNIRALPPSIKKLLWGSAVLALILSGFIYWKTHTAPALETQFKTEKLITGDVTQTVSANGTLNPVVLVNVGTQVSGAVKTLHADFNDHVTKGQILLELDSALLQAQVHQSEATVSSAEASLALATSTKNRKSTLLDLNFLSKQEYDQAVQAVQVAHAQVLQARAQLGKDKSNLAYATIRSPVSGVIVDRQVDVGQTVAASFQTPTLFRIAQDLRKMQIDSSFAEADIGNIKMGQQVRFNVDAFSNRNFEGIVRQVRLNPTAQQNVITYDVVVSVDNPDQILMPGMTAYVTVIVTNHNNVLLIPNAALRFKPTTNIPLIGSERKQGKRAPTQAVAYILEKGKLKPVTLETGISDNRYTEIVSGPLKANDHVIVEDTRVSASPQTSSTLRMRMF